MVVVAVFLLPCALLVMSLGHLAAARRRARTSGSGTTWDAEPLSVLEAAFLAGGPARVTDTVLAGMHADGRVLVSGRGHVVLTDRAPARPLESALIEALQPTGQLPPAELRQAVMRHQDVQAIGDGLAARGLLVPPPLYQEWRRAVRRRAAHWCCSRWC